MRLGSSLRWMGILLLHTLTALIGTAIVATPVERLWRPQTTSGVVMREWILSVTIALALGIFNQSAKKSRPGLYVWILPTGLAAVWSLAFVSIPRNSVLQPTSSFTDVFSGRTCSLTGYSPECRAWIIFSISAARGICYSVGGLVGLKLHDHLKQTTAKSTEPSLGQ